MTQHRWKHPNIPQKGWSWINIIDMEEPCFTCEMCGKTEIRYVHTMWHPVKQLVLKVGCICAENMLDDYVNPKKRERKFITHKKREVEQKRAEEARNNSIRCMDFVLKKGKLSRWEREFMISIKDQYIARGFLSERQIDTFKRLFDKIKDNYANPNGFGGVTMRP